MATQGAGTQGDSKARKGTQRSALGVVRKLSDVMLAFVLVVLAATQSQPMRNLLRVRIEQRINAKLNGTARIAKLDYALFGSLAISGVRVVDDTGQEIVKLDSLRIVPGWSNLVRGQIVIDSVALNGLALHVVQYADGTSNLKRLVKPSPPEPPKVDKPNDRRVQLRALSIGGVQVDIDKPDGTRMSLSDFGLEASIDAVPSRKTVLLSVPRVHGAFVLDKGEPLKVKLSQIETALAADLKEGAGTLRVARTTTHLNVLQSGAEPRELDVDLSGIDVRLRPGELEAIVGKLSAAALIVQSIEVRGHATDGVLTGPQEGKILGLHVDASKLNALLQKNVVSTDVDFETRIAGPPHQLGLVTNVITAGGKLSLTGTVDISVRETPKYDLVLGATGLATERLLHPDARSMPPIELDKLTLGLKGAGTSKDTAHAGFSLTIGRTTVGKIQIDSAVVEGRLVPGEVIIDSLTVLAVGQQVTANARLLLADKHLNARVAIEGDVGAALGRLKRAGVAIKTALPEGLVVLRKGTLVATVSGKLDEGLDAVVDLDKLSVAGGTVTVRANANIARKEPGVDGKKFEARSLDAEVTLHGLRLSSLAQLRGKQLKGIDGTVSGKVVISGTPKEPAAKYALELRAAPTDRADAPSLAISLLGTASKHDVAAKLRAVKWEGSRDSLVADGEVKLPIWIGGAGRGLSAGRGMRVKFDLPRQALSSLTALVPAHLLVGRKIPAAALEAHLDLSGTPDHPQGRVELDVSGPIAPQRKQRAHVDMRLEPRGDATALAVDADVWLDTPGPAGVRVRASADLSRSPLMPGPRDLQWKATLDAGPQKLADLPVAAGKLDSLKGQFELHANLHGNRQDVLGDLNLTVQDFARGTEMEPVAARLDLKIAPAQSTVALATRLHGQEVLRVSGTTGVAGTGLINTIRQKKLAEAALDIQLDFPKRPLSDLAGLRRALAAAPGQLEAKLNVTGSIGTPLLAGGVVLDDFATLNGGKGRAAIALNAGMGILKANVDLGIATTPDKAPVHLEVQVPREALARFRAEQGNLPIAIIALASHVDVTSLVPSMVTKGKKMEVAGQLDWDMKGGVELQKSDAGNKLVRGAITGRLEIQHGLASLPGTHRRFRDVQLRVVSDADSLRIETLSLRESDMQKANRTLRLDGKLAWDNLRPRSLDAHIQAGDWLVFASGEFGTMDAPRACLSLDADINADLSAAIRPVTVNVKSLELLLPDRFPKAHQAEETHLGDVVYLDEPGAVLGKLVVPESLQAKSKELARPQESQSDVALEGAVPTSGAASTGYDIHIKIPNRVHILKDPLDLIARGEIDVTVRGATRKIQGALRPEGGFLSLGGKQHPFDHGTVTFDEEHPKGWMDLHFKRVVPNAAIRDISIASRGDGVKIGMVGLIGQQVTTLDGAGSPGTLFDLLSMHNVGHARYLSGPDMPATATVEYPQHDNLLMISYMSVNLPHLLFLDRLAAWADPYDRRDAYGHVQHLEAERYSADGSRRVRAISRMRRAGQSQAEVQLDWLWTNNQRSVFGVGITAGSRLGGGPGVFYEWSSEN